MGYALRVLGILAFFAALALAGFLAFQFLRRGDKPGPPAEAALVCPPSVSLAPRAPDAPRDDLAGLRLGFSVQEAQDTLKCAHGDYKFAFQPFWHTETGDQTVRQMMYARRGYEIITAGLVGMPKQERIFALWREVGHPPDSPAPPVQPMVDDLIARYGAPHETKTMGVRREMWWLYDGRGAPMKSARESGDPISGFIGWAEESLIVSACKSHVSVDSMRPPTWSGNCGVTIRAELETRADRTTALRYRVALVDQARLAGAVAAYRATLAPASAAPSAAPPNSPPSAPPPSWPGEEREYGRGRGQP